MCSSGGARFNGLRWLRPADAAANALVEARLDALIADISAGPAIATAQAVATSGDEDMFDHADDLDIERPNADRHLSFGYGIHFCMGSRLAELQARVLWEEILQRFERIEIQEEPERTFSSFANGYTHLPVQIARK